MPGAKRSARGPKSWPSPKRGKARILRNFAKKVRKTLASIKKPPKNVPYVPPNQVKDSKTAARQARQMWCASVSSLARMTECQTITHLRGIKLLPPEKRTCPFCAKGRLGKLTKIAGRGMV